MGRTSPDAVTVCFSSGLTSSFTVTTSGSSLRVATTLMTTTMASTTATTTPIMIFFLRLNAILGFLLLGGLQNLEDVSTWKLIKQFHRRANAIRANLLTLWPQRSTKHTGGLDNSRSKIVPNCGGIRNLIDLLCVLGVS